jgi:PIN domain nuclease of toxin-antitoxin system
VNQLLDTHTLIWFLEGEDELSNVAKSQILNPDNTNFISIITFWEIAIKISIAKLEMKSSFENLNRIVWENNMEVLPIKFEHTLKISSLPFFHKDPFDRLMIAQGLVENMPIITKDENFKLYEVQIIW